VGICLQMLPQNANNLLFRKPGSLHLSGLLKDGLYLQLEEVGRGRSPRRHTLHYCFCPRCGLNTFQRVDRYVRPSRSAWMSVRSIDEIQDDILSVLQEISQRSGFCVLYLINVKRAVHRRCVGLASNEWCIANTGIHDSIDAGMINCRIHLKSYYLFDRPYALQNILESVS